SHNMGGNVTAHRTQPLRKYASSDVGAPSGVPVALPLGRPQCRSKRLSKVFIKELHNHIMRFCARDREQSPDIRPCIPKSVIPGETMQRPTSVVDINWRSPTCDSAW